MSLTNDLSAIRAHFIAEWDDETYQTVFANGQPETLDPDRPYVRFGVDHFDGQIVGGNKLRRDDGIIWLQVFVPNGDGTMTAYEIAEIFKNIFKDWSVGDLRTGNYFSTPVHGSNDYFQLKVGYYWQSLNHD
ncbi:hypothetical protein [Brevundimonas olei]|uniref:hypothetical protein n=1 Tax=Brevundimonas olei TaxID=657642 RepID=UPI0031D6D791